MGFVHKRRESFTRCGAERDGLPRNGVRGENVSFDGSCNANDTISSTIPPIWLSQKFEV